MKNNLKIADYFSDAGPIFGGPGNPIPTGGGQIMPPNYYCPPAKLQKVSVLP